MRICNARTHMPQIPIVRCKHAAPQMRYCKADMLWWVNTAGSLLRSAFLMLHEVWRTWLFPSAQEGWGHPHLYSSFICEKLGCDPVCLNPDWAFSLYYRLLSALPCSALKFLWCSPLAAQGC